MPESMMHWSNGGIAITRSRFFSPLRSSGCLLLHAEGSQPSGLFLPPLGDPFLGADLSLHLGRSASPALHRSSGLDTDPGDGFQSDADCPFVGWHDQRTDDPAGGLGKTGLILQQDCHHARLQHRHLLVVYSLILVVRL